MIRQHEWCTPTRRSVIKSAAASGAAIAVTGVFAPAVHAARSLKLGYVSPQTGPLAAFAEADNFVISNFLNTVRGGLKIGSGSYPVEVIVKDSQSNPNRAADVANELIVVEQGRPDAGRLDAGNHQSGRHHVRGRGDRRASRRWRRGSPISSAGRQNPGDPASLEAVQLRPSTSSGGSRT